MFCNFVVYLMLGLCLLLIGQSIALRLHAITRYTRLRDRLADQLDSSYAPESDFQPGDGALRQLQVRFNCEEIDSELISEVLFEAGVLSVSVEVEQLVDDVYTNEKRWSDLQRSKSWRTAFLRANIPSSFDAQAVIELLHTVFEDDKVEVSVVDVENKDWVKSVQQDWRPQVVGDLTIKFPWHQDVSTNTTFELILQGGAAFGTGDHPTTRLCCRWLQEAIGGNPHSKLSVLDYGTGSGLLGLAALLYGASEAVGTDIDKDALVNAQFNCVQNNLTMDLYFVTEEDCSSFEEKSVAMMSSRRSDYDFPAVHELGDKKFDITVANILAPILVDLAPTLAARTMPGGLIALSGLVEAQAGRVIDAYSSYFEGIRISDSEDDWVVITGKRKSSSSQ